MEVGTHSAWARDVVASCGHEVLVANPRQMEGPKRRKRKNDRIDAHKLARVGRMDPQSLFAIELRGSIPLWLLHRIDHVVRHWPLLRLQSQPQLLAQCIEEIWTIQEFRRQGCFVETRRQIRLKG
jgi:hypothetical protein